MDIFDLLDLPVDSLVHLAHSLTAGDEQLPHIPGSGRSFDAAREARAAIDQSVRALDSRVGELATLAEGAAVQWDILRGGVATLLEEATAVGLQLTPAGLLGGIDTAAAALFNGRLGEALAAATDLSTELSRRLLELVPTAEPEPVVTQESSLDKDLRNRHRLAQLRRDLPEQLRHSHGDERWRLAAKIRDLEAIADTLARHPQALLLGLDMSGERGRAIVAIGNPDTARQVTVQVPGLDSDVEHTLPAMVDTAARLQAEIASRTGETTASIAWLDYTPAQLEGPGNVRIGDTKVGIGLLETALPLRAAAGAERLDGFLDGFAADQHVTVLGHSYGSTTAGLALTDDAVVRVDDLVVFGSPGIFASTPSELGLLPGHVFVMETPDDLVAKVGLTGWFGADPGLSDFTQLPLAPHDGLRAPSGHSEYLRPGTTSWEHVLQIASGQR